MALNKYTSEDSRHSKKVFKLDDFEMKMFKEWKKDGNVSKNSDGTYSTQDAGYRNRLKDLDALKEYFYNEYIKGQFDSYKGGGEAGFNDEGTSMALYHEKKGNWIVPKGQIYLWLYDVEGSAEKLQNEEFDWVFYPITSQNMAWQSGYIPPLQKIWTKRFQKQHKGSEHLLGVIKAFLIKKDNGQKELYIDMMSVNPTKKKKGIMSYMIKDLRDSFDLSQDQVTFSKLTPEGEKFVAKKTYADGGGVKSEKYVHKYNPNITIEILDYTNKGVKAIQKNPKSLSKKEKKEGIIVFYSNSELKELFDKKYDDGGDIPNEDKMFHLPLEMVVYVPSTQDVDNVISVDEMDKRVDIVKEYLASKFGGYTSSDKLGGYVDSKGNLVNEEVVQVVSFSTKEAFEQNKDELINKLSEWARLWGQEAIGFEFEGDLMYVPQKFADGGDIKKKINFYYEKYENGGYVGGDIIKFNFKGKEYTRKVESVDENGNALVNLFKTEKAIVNPADISEIKKEFDDKSIIVNKIGLNESNADFLLNLSPTFAVWLADKIVEAYTDIDNGITRKKASQSINDEPRILTQLRDRIRTILDWLQHPTTRKQNLRELSFKDAELKAKEWHEELKVQGGDINFTEPQENTVFKEYPENDNGVKYYWVYIPQNYCDVESNRMGHCGRTSANSLISLRSIRPYTENDTITDSHVTVAFDNNDGYIYQSKGKKNQKPAQKYFPYIFDLIKILTTNEIVEKQKEKNEQKIQNLNADLKDYQIAIQAIEGIYTNKEYDYILSNITSLKSQIIKQKNYISTLTELDVTDELEKLKKLDLELLNEEEKFRKKAEKYIADIDGLRQDFAYRILSSPKTLSSLFRDYLDDSYSIQRKIEEMDVNEFNTFKGFKSEYQSSQDYGWSDMTKEEIKELYEINPELFDTFSSRYVLFDAGLTDEKPNSEFVMYQDVKYINNLLSTDVRDDIFEEYFTSGSSEIYEADFSYYYENAGDYVDDLKPNQYEEVINKIVEITGLDKEVVEENGAKHYLDGYDDDFTKYDFEDISRAMASALTQAEEDDYSNHFYSTLKSSLEELGEVQELNDTGLTLKVDLSKLLNPNQIGSYMESLETESLEDVFWEAQREGEITLPNFYLDDRYTAEPKDWQEYFDIDNY